MHHVAVESVDDLCHLSVNELPQFLEVVVELLAFFVGVGNPDQDFLAGPEELQNELEVRRQLEVVHLLW